ncbi:DNA mismatch repair protein MutS [Paramuribaculum intestinale]|uniref:DNA mismatch repair protein MutS n=1 Tax=Paramuribaculum intestinale TaxID=2094151 RepID=A0A2V1IR93_9BACT|nr:MULTISPECIES: DNA mismatch repair protein MutS [Muribaculaceae]ROS90692.1 DNA mismatch repair protein MutS [Muribaculaceae bacterium Isolate-043 (Harlan)]MCX4277730.1 DNA mismatch repair protein MutS [Muribaculum sp.]PWB06956.1 DNA mismatch repair protein MutS [Paramuribaculum intestinale]PWB09023.1 DNA mismatch repair protein MutS [Paramuribaculum intestinale]WLT42379.1 DNA mismatch repair protein MutS [Paramuribaculum intestinale]
MKQKPENIDGILDQFVKMKEKHPDALLLFRIGDTYQSFKQDAVKASTILDIETREKKVDGKKVKSIGFPHHALDTYLPRLVRAGMRVAICEQLEKPQKIEKEKSQSTTNEADMPRKKKEQAAQEEPVKSVKADKPAEEKKTEVKSEAKSEQSQEAKAERKPREPQMVTVNGDKVTHGHAYQSKTNPEDWYFTAKINGEQLKPQKMDPADLAAYQKKEMTVPQLMERYYPTKLMQRVPDVAFQVANVVSGPEQRPLTVDKFNVYKEKDEQRPDFGRYKFYAEVDGQKMSTVASRQDLNAYFDRVQTPGQLVEKNFGERLHLPSHYQQFRLPEGVEASVVRIAKDRSDNKWKVSADLGEHGRTDKKEISFDDGFALFKTKTATREQIAAKYLGEDIKTMLNGPVMSMEKSQSMKM